jgi:hypothetical protein
MHTTSRMLITGPPLNSKALSSSWNQQRPRAEVRRQKTYFENLCLCNKRFGVRMHAMYACLQKKCVHREYVCVHKTCCACAQNMCVYTKIMCVCTKKHSMWCMRKAHIRVHKTHIIVCTNSKCIFFCVCTKRYYTFFLFFLRAQLSQTSVSIHSHIIRVYTFSHHPCLYILTSSVSTHSHIIRVYTFSHHPCLYILTCSACWFAGAFFMTNDKRFILKTLVRSEANFLLDILYYHYEHVLK